MLAFYSDINHCGGHEEMACLIAIGYTKHTGRRVIFFTAKSNRILKERLAVLNAELPDSLRVEIVDLNYVGWRFGYFINFISVSRLANLARLLRQYGVSNIIVVQGWIGACTLPLMLKYSGLMNIGMISYVPMVSMGAKVFLKSLKKWLYREILGEFDKIITIDNNIETQLRKTFNISPYVVKNFPKIDCTLIRSGVKLSSPPKFAVVGRIRIEQKGQLHLVKALGKYIGSPIEIHFIGDGPDLRLLKKEVEIHFNPRVEYFFHGWISDKRHIYSIFDILLIPSLYEGFPMVLIEAAYLNIPMVASNLSCFDPVIDRDFRFDVNDESSIHSAIEGILTADAGRLKAYLEKCQANAMKLSSESQSIREFISVIEEKC